MIKYVISQFTTAGIWVSIYTSLHNFFSFFPVFINYYLGVLNMNAIFLVLSLWLPPIVVESVGQLGDVLICMVNSNLENM